jgi:hypothetical protein
MRSPSKKTLAQRWRQPQAHGRTAMPFGPIWIAATGDFTDAADWSPAGVPQAGETALINQGTCTIANLNVSAVYLVVGILPLASAGGEIVLDNAIAGNLSLYAPTPQAPASGTVEVVGHSTITSGGVLGGTENVLTFKLANHAILSSLGTYEVYGSDTIDVSGGRGSRFINDGTLTANGGSFDIGANIGGHGTTDILLNPGFPPSISEVEFGGSVGRGQTVNLDAGVLKLDKPAEFHGSIDGFNAASTIEIAGTITSERYVGDVLNLFDGKMLEAQLTLPGSFTSASFDIAHSGPDSLITLAASTQVETPSHCLAMATPTHGF